MNNPPTTIPVAELADVWRGRDDNPRWPEAYEQITAIIGPAIRRHSIVRQAPLEEQNDLVDGFISEFWIHLVDNPATLEAGRVKGKDVIKTEAMRFMDRYAARGSGDHREELRWHLHDKVRKALRDDPRFTEQKPQWMLTVWGGVSPGPFKTNRQVQEQLGLLKGKYRAQRGNQRPPLVQTEDLPPFLEQCLDLSGRAQTAWALTDFTWKSLEPPPETMLSFDENPPPSSEAEAIRREWSHRIDIVAGNFVDNLPQQTARVVHLHLQKKTFESIGKELGISKSTANAKWKKFQQEFSAVVNRDGLDKSQARQLIEVVQDILKDEPFHKEQEGPER